MMVSSGAAHFCHGLLRARDWQDRPQLSEVCQWWETGGVGVCALIGIGGAGKTAVADRFLQVLPGVLPDHPNVPKRTGILPPSHAFVFSFYDAPNPDSFFAAIADWRTLQQTTRAVRGSPDPAHSVDRRSPESELLANGVGDLRTNESASSETLAEREATSEIRVEQRQPSYHQILQLFQSAAAIPHSQIENQKSKILLVLDGLEKVQDDGARGGVFGDLQDGRLNDLLMRVAEGYLQNVSILITSRFPLAKLDERGSVYYRPIAVEEIEPATAVALLRLRGVRGTDNQLQSIAAECGHHALTVDLAGGFIAEFGSGDPKTPLRLSRFDDEEQARRAEPTNSGRRAVRVQEYRFTRVAERYREGFKETDPAALALLERICLFRLGVTAKTLASIFTGKSKRKKEISGSHLAGLLPSQLQEKLDRLVAMRLLEANESSGSQPSNLGSRPSYSVHPAVRDGFLVRLDPQTAKRGHVAAIRGLNAVLLKRPGEKHPTDRATLDYLEEIIFHALEAKRIGLAWSFYGSDGGV